MLEVIEHTLGLCGDNHANLVSFLLEIPQISYTFTYIKTLFK